MASFKEKVLGVRRNLGRFKGKTLENIKSASWYLKHKTSFTSTLASRFGITNLETFKFLDWHLGCNYFLGVDQKTGNKVFVKTGGDLKLAKVEAEALMELNNVSTSANFPRLIAHQDNDPYSFVAIEFIEGSTLSDYLKLGLFNSNKDKYKILMQINEIIKQMHRLKIVHRDIRPDNLLLRTSSSKGDIQLVLIDFAFAVDLKKGLIPNTENFQNEARLLKYLGDGWNPEPFSWDDAYSFFKIAKTLEPMGAQKFPGLWEEIRSRVGKVTFKCEKYYNCY